MHQQNAKLLVFSYTFTFSCHLWEQFLSLACGEHSIYPIYKRYCHSKIWLTCTLQQLWRMLCRVQWLKLLFWATVLKCSEKYSEQFRRVLLFVEIMQFLVKYSHSNKWHYRYLMAYKVFVWCFMVKISLISNSLKFPY